MTTKIYFDKIKITSKTPDRLTIGNRIMKNDILQIFAGFSKLDSDDIINLNGNDFENNTFKLHLLKDQKKGAKISDTKFYIEKDGRFIKFEYDEILNKLMIIPSTEMKALPLLINSLNIFNLKKIEVYCTDEFIDLQKQLLNFDYHVELNRKDRFLNHSSYHSEIVLSYLKEN